MNTASLDHVFHALADGTRRRILEQLADGEETVMVLAGRFDISQPAVTKHLNVLERAGLISRHAEGRTRTCRLQPEALDASRQWIDNMQTYWNSHLDALEAFLANPPARKTSHANTRRRKR